MVSIGTLGLGGPCPSTPTTLFSDQDRVVLPGANEGPAVMMVGPYSNFTDALVRQFSTATLIDQPARPGGAPFRLYSVKARPLAPEPHAVMGNDLQLSNTPAQPVTFEKNKWLVSQWELMRSAQPGYRQVYGYTIAQLETYDDITTPTTMLKAGDGGDRLVIPVGGSVRTENTQVRKTFKVTQNHQ